MAHLFLPTFVRERRGAFIKNVEYISGFSLWRWRDVKLLLKFNKKNSEKYFSGFCKLYLFLFYFCLHQSNNQMFIEISVSLSLSKYLCRFNNGIFNKKYFQLCLQTFPLNLPRTPTEFALEVRQFHGLSWMSWIINWKRIDILLILSWKSPTKRNLSRSKQEIRCKT